MVWRVGISLEGNGGVKANSGWAGPPKKLSK